MDQVGNKMSFEERANMKKTSQFQEAFNKFMTEHGQRLRVYDGEVRRQILAEGRSLPTVLLQEASRLAVNKICGKLNDKRRQRDGENRSASKSLGIRSSSPYNMPSSNNLHSSNPLPRRHLVQNDPYFYGIAQSGRPSLQGTGRPSF